MRLVVIASVLVSLWFLSLMVGWHTQPWSQWWFGQQTNHPISVEPSNSFAPSIPIDLPTSNHVTDFERYQLALTVGWTPAQAIIATALSIAEDGSGDPAIVSKPNWNNTVDIGLWQINSAHIGNTDIPSMQWLFIPINNARAAFAIAGPHLNWCAWSTYEPSCGVGHNGAYRAFLSCARAISEGATCRR